MIARDLWDNIIQYVSINALHDLSKASPIFDQMICKTGLRVFYDNYKGHVIGIWDRLIMLESGRKLLLSPYDRYRYINRGLNRFRARVSTIIRAKKISNNERGQVTVDRDRKISVVHTYGLVRIIRGRFPGRVGNITRGISDEIDCIDFASRLTVTKSYHDISYESFVVLYHGCWKSK